MARDNISWGEERIANELLLKLGIPISPRTVRKYMPKRPPDRPRGDQRWLTFVDHPTAAWTLQQLREAIPSDHSYQYLLNDRDRIFSIGLEASIKGLGLRVLKSPNRSPLANCFCERVIGSLRRECLDFLIPLTQQHLVRFVNDWATYYNMARPHMSRGPGIPSPPETLPVAVRSRRHQLREELVVSARPVLGGLHHD